jgi:hypothetical protein
MYVCVSFSFFPSFSPRLSQNFYYDFSVVLLCFIIFIDHRSQGRNTTPSLGWLIGAVMPLDAVGNVRNLDAVINGFHF